MSEKKQGNPATTEQLSDLSVAIRDAELALNNLRELHGSYGATIVTGDGLEAHLLDLQRAVCSMAEALNHNPRDLTESAHGGYARITNEWRG